VLLGEYQFGKSPNRPEFGKIVAVTVEGDQLVKPFDVNTPPSGVTHAKGATRAAEMFPSVPAKSLTSGGIVALLVAKMF
jgi:hypothetical protein